jgi:oxygen-independent coproporphyrinogen III oxidase
MLSAPLSASELVQADPYLAYAYSYPHKTAYRPLERPISLRELWSTERRDALSLYIHVPFCEMRCGFCNLFTQARPKDGVSSAYVSAVSRQASRVREAIAQASFARFAIGGGTPTQLEEVDLEALFSLAEGLFGVDLTRVPSSVETSPETATEEKIAILKRHSVSRVSIGVQSFFEEETKAIQRPQKRQEVYAALERIKAKGFQTLNIDLMYGLPGQTTQTWLASLQEALRFQPEELYLYPLYVRPLTGMGRHAKRPQDNRLQMYQEAKDFLRMQGFSQVSMRMFRNTKAPRETGPLYTCQTDGMIGLGCGARSYTKTLHYSEEYAVGKEDVREIIEAYIKRPEERFSQAWYGFSLDEDEQRRRFVILSLLQDGVVFSEYQTRFASSVLNDFPQLGALVPEGLATQSSEALTLTEQGVARSDLIGAWLFSPSVQQKMDEYEAR